MSSTTRTCKICGATYTYCPTCGSDMNKPKWMASFDKSECKQIFDILSSNGIGNKSNEEALSDLNKMNYSSIKIVNKSVLNHIDRLKNSPAPVSAPAQTKESEQSVVETETNKSKQEEQKEEEQSTNKFNNNFNKKDKNKNKLSFNSNENKDNKDTKTDSSVMPSFLSYAGSDSNTTG